MDYYGLLSLRFVLQFLRSLPGTKNQHGSSQNANIKSKTYGWNPSGYIDLLHRLGPRWHKAASAGVLFVCVCVWVDCVLDLGHTLYVGVSLFSI